MLLEEELSPVQQRWWNHLQRAEKESLSIRAYAAREGLSEQSLYAFRKRLKQRRGSGGASLPALPTFATVQVTRSNAEYELAFVGGVTLRLEQLPDPAWLIAVLGRISALHHTAVVP